MHYVLFYEKIPGFQERQTPFLAAHREHVLAAEAAGSLVLAGSLTDPDDGAALLVFDSPDVAESFAKADPCVREGIVHRWSVRSWELAVGKAKLESR